MSERTETTVEKLDKLIVFATGEALLAQQAQAFSAIPPIQGPDDELALKVTRNAWLTLRGYRTKIEADRKTLKEPFLDACKKIDAEAKRLTAICKPTEDALCERVDKVETEIAERKRLRVTERQDQFRAVDMILPDEVVGGMDDETFATQLEGARLRFEAVQKQRAEEAAAALRKAEAEAEAKRKFADEQAELARQRAAFEAEKAAFEASKPPPSEVVAPVVTSAPTPAGSGSNPAAGAIPERARKWLHDCPFCKCAAR